MDAFHGTLHDLMRNPRVSLYDKRRAYVCYCRNRIFPGLSSPKPLSTGDRVTLRGLQERQDLNESSGRLGSYDGQSGRWEVTGPSVKVKPVNLVKKEWMDGDCCHWNTSAVVGDSWYTLRIEPETLLVRCLASMPASIMTHIRISSELNQMHESGFNDEEPWNSRYLAIEGQ